MKPTIYAIVGASGSGKTLMAEYLQEAHGIPTVVSYTTRPMRQGETDGKEHYFVTPEDMPPKDQMLAYTHFGNYDYWALLSQVESHQQVTYVIDEDGLIDLQDRYSDKFFIVPICVVRPQKEIQSSIDNERLERDRNRATLDPSVYRATIFNDGSISDFKQRITIIFNFITNGSTKK